MSYNGREFTMSWDGTVITGVQTKGANQSRTLVDTTNDDDAGWATQLAEPGVQTITTEVSGVTKDDILLAEAMNGTYAVTAGVLTYPSGATVTGNWLISSLNTTGAHDGAVEFSATLQLNGAPTFAAAP